MKTSIKLLLAALGVVLVSITISIIVLRANWKPNQIKKEKVEKLALKNFDKIIVDGDVDIQVYQKNNFEILVEGDLKMEGISTVIDSNHALHLYSKVKNNKLSMKIGLPKLIRLETHGNANVQLNNFKTDSLALCLYDHSDLDATNNWILSLNVQASGESNLDVLFYKGKRIELRLQNQALANIQNLSGVLSGELNDSTRCVVENSKIVKLNLTVGPAANLNITGSR